MVGRNDKPDYSVRLTNVYKYYEATSIEVKALEDITFELERGAFAAIVGPSGSGKSTLMNLLGTIDKPTKGEIYIDETPTSQMSGDALAEFRSKKLGFIFQAFNLVNGLDAQHNVELPMLVNHMQRGERKKRAEDLLDRLGLSDRLKLKPTQLSGGQQQRVAVARALVNNPSLILADEPTGNLDSKSGAEVLKLFDEISASGNVTIVMVTHNPDTTKHCSKVVYLKDGHVEKIVNRG
jgi:putative ABC transport system ATP-binding protein